jgi:hypothetical protein
VLRSILFHILRLVISVGLSCLTFAAVGFALDKVSEHFERGTFVRDFAETVLGFMAPVTFGFLILPILFIVFYFWLVPRWIPTARAKRVAGA